MRSNYKRLGDYIRQVDVRNRDLKVTKLMGVSIQKVIMPSIANIVGTDMSTYKVVNRNQFVYGPVTSRNGDKVSIALFTEDVGIVSQAYTSFEIIDTTELLPEYLMLWFMRPEFDRYARFMSHGSAREIFGWDEMCDVTLPVPDIKVQQQIVDEYNVVKKRIDLNERLIKTLEETAQAVYKQWFVDFDFPDENGNPYKTSGGKMVNSELGEIPDGWSIGVLEGLCNIIDGDRGTNYPSQKDFLDKGHCVFLNAGNVKKTGFDFLNPTYISKEKDEQLRKGKLERGDIVFTSRGTVGNSAFFSDAIRYENIRINSGMIILRAQNTYQSCFLYRLIRSHEMSQAVESYTSGSAQPQLPIKDFSKIAIILPSSKIIDCFSILMNNVELHIDSSKNCTSELYLLKDILLSKLSTVEV